MWLDAGLSFVYVNDRAARLLRRPAGEVVGRPYAEVLPQQATTALHGRLERAVAAGERDTFEGYAPDLDRWVRRQCVPTAGGGALVLVADVTERYRAQTASIRARSLLAAVGEALPDAVVVLDADRHLLAVNEAARALFGVPSAVEALVAAATPGGAWPLAELVADPEGFAADVAALYGGAARAREDVALADGRTLTRDFVPIAFGADREPGSVWTYRDVTAARERERAAAAEGAFLERVADAVPDALYLYDLAADAYDPLNHGTAERLREAAGGPGRRDALAALDGDAVRTERRRVPGRGGRWVEVRESAFARDREGRVTTAIGLVRDVTAEVAAEDALREQGEFVETLLAGVPDIVYVIDLVQSANVWANRELTAVLGYTQEDLHSIGPGIETALIHPDDLARLGPFYAELDALPAGAFATVEYRVRHKDGSWRWLQVRQSVTERDGGGRPLRALGVAQDVTDALTAREALAAWGRQQGRIAQALQRPLVVAPRLPRPSPVEVAPLYRPARDDAAVGGDLFDVVYLADGRVALVVGDVTGKGLVAAANTAQAKYTLRTLLLEGHEPEAALARLNDYVLHDEGGAALGRDLYVTVSVAVLDPAGGAVRFAVAGAEPPLIARRGGAVTVVRAGGVPLAFLPGWGQDGADARLPLGPGDLVVLYTDGLTEAHEPDGPMFGVDGVATALAGPGRGPPADRGRGGPRRPRPRVRRRPAAGRRVRARRAPRVRSLSPPRPRKKKRAAPEERPARSGRGGGLRYDLEDEPVEGEPVEDGGLFRSFCFALSLASDATSFAFDFASPATSCAFCFTSSATLRASAPASSATSLATLRAWSSFSAATWSACRLTASACWPMSSFSASVSGTDRPTRAPAAIATAPTASGFDDIWRSSHDSARRS